MSNIFQWQLHGDGKTLAPGEVVEPDERLTWAVACYRTVLFS